MSIVRPPLSAQARLIEAQRCVVSRQRRFDRACNALIACPADATPETRTLLAFQVDAERHDLTLHQAVLAALQTDLSQESDS